MHGKAVAVASYYREAVAPYIPFDPKYHEYIYQEENQQLHIRYLETLVYTMEMTEAPR